MPGSFALLWNVCHLCCLLDDARSLLLVLLAVLDVVP